MHMQTNTDFRPHLRDKNIELHVLLILSAIYQIEKISGTYLALGKERWSGCLCRVKSSHIFPPISSYLESKPALGYNSDLLASTFQVMMKEDEGNTGVGMSVPCTVKPLHCLAYGPQSTGMLALLLTSRNGLEPLVRTIQEKK